MAIYFPPVFINEYLAEKVAEEFSGQTFPILPSMPIEIHSLTEQFPDSNGLFAVYDRMFKLRRTPFPHIKSEQLLYYFYKMDSDIVRLFEITQKVQDLLDRGDESAQEINDWISRLPRGTDDADGRQTRIIAGTEFLMPYFHEIKVYQLEETRDIIDFGTARTYAGNKIIIDYDWHKS